MRIALAALSALLLAACSSEIDQAKQLLTQSLVTDQGLEFHELKSYPGDAVCGTFSGTASYTDPPVKMGPFIVLSGVLDRSPGDLDWKIYCSDDPIAALAKHTGIGPFGAENTEMIKVVRDYTLLGEALETYYNDLYEYPTTEEGLQSLQQAPANLRRKSSYRSGGYLETVPQDPWGRPYTYEHVRWGRTKGYYTIVTLGASGKPGGSGPEQDIDSKYLPYLQHALRTLGLSPDPDL